MSEKTVTQTEYSVLTGWDSWDDIVLITKKGKKTDTLRMRNIDWYFAVKTADFKRIGGVEKMKEIPCVRKTAEDGDFTLIYCKSTAKDPETTKLIQRFERKNIAVYESDLSRTKRFLVDTKVPIAEDLNILYFDIETDDSHKTGIEIGRDTILSWAGYNNRGRSWYRVDTDEKKLLQDLIALIDKHDVFVGWNSQKFDLPYIIERMKRYDLKYDWRQRIHLDLMKRCIKLYSYEMDKIGLTGFSLDEIARVFLGDAKVKHEEGIKEMFDNNRELLEKYNRHDAELLLKLDTKLEIIKLMVNECVWTGTTLNRFFVGELLDNYMLRRSKEKHQYLHSRPSSEESEKNLQTHIIGGYVKPPITGLYEDVRIFDFKSLYPSMIVSWNIGPDSIDREKSKIGDANFDAFVTKDRKIEDVTFEEWFKFLRKQKKLIDPNDECVQTANNNFFRKDIPSFIANLIKELLELRSVMKKKLAGLQPGSPEYGSTRSAQAIVKELANSMYGITGDRNSRYFDKNVAESITITGQFMNKTSSAIIEKLSGATVVYGDTDSIFVPIPGTNEDVDALNEKVNETLKEFLNTKFRLPHNIVYLEYEKAYRKMIMVDKKRYSGTLVWLNSQKIDQLFSKGLEDVKKNTIGITKKAMRELFKMITHDDKGLPEVNEWLLKLKEYVFSETSGIVKEDITISTRLSKPTTSYASKSAYVFLAEEMIKKGLILQPKEEADSWGTRIDYVISTSTPKQTAVHVDDYDGVWDRRYYWDTQIYAPIMRVLQTIWPDEDWAQHSIIEQEKKAKLLEREAKKKEREELAIQKAKERVEKAEAKKLRDAEREKAKKERELARKLKAEQKAQLAAEKAAKRVSKQQKLFD